MENEMNENPYEGALEAIGNEIQKVSTKKEELVNTIEKVHPDGEEELEKLWSKHDKLFQRIEELEAVEEKLHEKQNRWIDEEAMSNPGLPEGSYRIT